MFFKKKPYFEKIEVWMKKAKQKKVVIWYLGVNIEQIRYKIVYLYYKIEDLIYKKAYKK